MNEGIFHCPHGLPVTMACPTCHNNTNGVAAHQPKITVVHADLDWRLNWPFDSFPEDTSTWNCAVNTYAELRIKYEKLLNLAENMDNELRLNGRSNSASWLVLLFEKFKKENP